MRKQKRGLGGVDGPDNELLERTKRRTASFSFGVSRHAMKKIHVDEILKKKEENLPGPDHYKKVDLFGGAQQALEFGQPQYSFRKKLDMEIHKLDKQRKLPGPGQYHAADLVGRGLSTSNMVNQPQNSIPRATDRFKPLRFQPPAPNIYNCKNGLTQNFSSTHRAVGRAIFGSSPRKNYLDMKQI